MAAGLLTAGAAHVPVRPEHLEQAPLWGVAFAAFTVVTVVLSVWVAWRNGPVVQAAAAILYSVAVAVYVVSRLIRLPGIGDDVSNWLEPWGVVSVLSETVTAVLALVGLRHRQ